MIGIHLQNSTRDWPRVANRTPITKILFGVERSAEVHNGLVWYRWVGHQPLPYSNFESHAEKWLRNFVDESFMKSAHNVDLINGYNETLANSQSAQERDRWIKLHTAMAKVWKERFRDVDERLSHIRLVMCETAVGNDIPLELARVSVEYDAVMGYHPYIACNVNSPIVPDNEYSGINRPGYVSPHDWRWYSGRWNFMDEAWRSHGVFVKWAFGEMGPVLDASNNWSGWLDPIGGWKSCLGGNLDRYNTVMKYWLDNATQTAAYHYDRILGGVLFTTGAPSDGQWDTFELREGDLEKVINFTSTYPYPPKTGNPPPPPPPKPEPPKPEPPVIPDGLPRLQYSRDFWVVPEGVSEEEYLRICKLAFSGRKTVGFSYDDAGIGALAKKRAMLFGIPENEKDIYQDWFEQHYPGTSILYSDLPEAMFDIHSYPIMASKLDLHRMVTQFYGENEQYYKDKFGIDGGHNGVDFGVPTGTLVACVSPGEVSKVDVDLGGYGIHVFVEHENGWQSRYAHLSMVNVSEGQKLASGELIGKTGNTGSSTGPHLHFELRHNGATVDPWPILVGF